MKLCLVTAVFVALLFACGGSDTAMDARSGSSGPPTSPTVAIVSPAELEKIELEDDDGDDNDRVEIEVEVEHATLAEPGHCSASGACGHLVLLIDGKACGTRNALSSSRHFQGKLGKCLKPFGPGAHELVVQLVDDHGNVLCKSVPILVEVRFKGRHGDGGIDHRDGGVDNGDGGHRDAGQGDDDDDRRRHDGGHDDDDDDDDDGHRGPGDGGHRGHG
jgi:hypothetical protein